MQSDMPQGSDNPFTAGHRETARRANVTAEAQERLARNDRAKAKGEAIKAVRPQPKPYQPAPFWNR